MADVQGAEMEELMQNKDFLQSVLSTLPGVNPEQALLNLQEMTAASASSSLSQSQPPLDQGEDKDKEEEEKMEEGVQEEGKKVRRDFLELHVCRVVSKTVEWCLPFSYFSPKQ